MATVCCSSGSCETAAQPQGGCPCGTSGCSGDPLDCATGMWGSSFMKALQQVQVELLKERVRKAWGAKMEKAADAALDAMGAQWQAMVNKAGAEAQFRQRLAALWQEGK